MLSLMDVSRESGVRWSWYFQGVKDNLELVPVLVWERVASVLDPKAKFAVDETMC